MATENTLNIRDKAKSITDLSPLAFDMYDSFHNGGNFCLTPMGDGNFLCYMRIFGYFIDGRGRYLSTPQTLISRPHVHRFCILDRNFNLVKKLYNVESKFYVHPMFSRMLPYLEDGRVVEWNRKHYISSTVCYQTKKGWAAIGLEVQKLELVGESILARHVWNSLECGGLDGLQKNWLPVPDMPFHYIMGTYSTGTQYIDISTGKTSVVGSISEDLYRGNTPLLKTQDGYIAITHKVDYEAHPKIYTNYFIKYGNDLSVKKISKPFKLTEQPIEFVTTLQYMNDEDIVIGVTANDDTPEAQIYNAKELFNSLEV